MKRVTQISAGCLMAALAFFAVHVNAQETNTSERSFLTFSGPVELPGVTLEAGTYEFKLANVDTSRNVVQVFKKEGREPVGQWTFVQAERPEPSDETMVMFKESREGVPPAIQYWYFPGEKIGKEFIYPKDQAERIAARTGQTVQSSNGAVKPSDTARNEPAAAETPAASASNNANNNANNGNAAAGDVNARAGEPTQSPAAPTAEAALRDAPASSQPSAPAGSTTGNRGVIPQPADQARAEAPAAQAEPIAQPEPSLEARAEVSPQVEPAPRPVGTSGAADVAQAPAATSGQAAAEPARELPQTASPLPLTALIGLLSLAGAAGLRALRA